MRFVIGKVPEDESFHPEEEGWKLLKEPKNFWVTQVIALPIAIVLCLITAVLIYLFVGMNIPDLGSSYLLAFIVVIPLHEFLHAVVFPESVFSDKTVFGFWPKMLAFYANYEGQMAKKRFLLVFLLPLVCISFLPIPIMSVFRIKSDFLASVCIINALCACVDVLGIIWVLKQVPKNAVVRNKGMKTYWKIKSSLDLEAKL